MKSLLGQHIQSNKNRYALLLFFVLLALGIGIAGAYLPAETQNTELRLTLENFFKTQSMSSLSPFKTQAMRRGMIFDGIFFVLFYIFTFTKHNASMLCFLLLIRGIICGYAIGFFVRCYGFDGFLFSFFTLMPQNFIKLILLLVFGVLALRVASMEISGKRESASLFFGVSVFLFLLDGAVVWMENSWVSSLMFVFAKELM